MGTKISALTNDPGPTLDDLLVSVNDPAGTPANRKVSISALAAVVGYPCQGRLTTETGVPVSTSDRTAQGTIYFTPFNGNTVALYTSSNWKLYTFTEKSLALSALTSAKNYDVFLYDNAGTLTIELSAAWSSDTARTDAIAQQDGIDVKSSDHSRRLIGTIRTTATTTTEDSLAKRFVWNKYNKVSRSLHVIETADTWTYTTATWRQANANTANQLAFVIGESQSANATVVATCAQTTAGAKRSVAVGVDSTTTPSGIYPAPEIGTGNTLPFASNYTGMLTLGYHFLAWLEYSQASGTSTWHGDGGLTFEQSGIEGTIWN